MTITCSVLTQIGAQEENCECKNVHFFCLLKLFGCFFLLSNVNGTREIIRSVAGFLFVRKKAFYRSFFIKSIGAKNNTSKLNGRATDNRRSFFDEADGHNSDVSTGRQNL